MFALLILILAAGEAKTDPVMAAYSPTFDRCLATGDAAQGVTAAQVNCTLAEHRRQDARLNQVYRDALARRSPAARSALRREERAWIGRRDAKCAKAYRRTGGTLDRVLGASCDLYETTARRLVLERNRY